MAIELPELLVDDVHAWHDFLARHHDAEPGVWLVLAKKGTTAPTSVTYDEALDEALCFGWIDGQVKKRDGATFQQRFTPRGPRSSWSARNVEHIARLTAAGRMHPAGVARVASAQADGRWDAAYHGPARIEVPADLASAISADPAAQAMFDVLTSQNRYAFLYRLTTIKRADTRARRIALYVAMLARGETFYPQRRRPAG